MQHSIVPPSLERPVALPSGTYPEWKCPQLAVLLTLGVRRRTAGREPFLYRDDLLEFDRGDLSRCTDGRKLVRRTGEVWWVQFARVRRLELTARLKVMSFMHSPDFSGSSQSHFMSISYFSVDWTVTIGA